MSAARPARERRHLPLARDPASGNPEDAPAPAWPPPTPLAPAVLLPFDASDYASAAASVLGVFEEGFCAVAVTFEITLANERHRDRITAALDGLFASGKHFHRWSGSSGGARIVGEFASSYDFETLSVLTELGEWSELYTDVEQVRVTVIDGEDPA